MKKILSVIVLFSALHLGCNDKTTEQKTVTTAALLSATQAIDTLCFEFKFKRDITSCQLIIQGDKVSGYFDWSPFEKDGAHGFLKNGVKNGDLITVDWQMMIEGNVQTEEILFKLENDRLNQMEGELIEKDDKLVFKSLETAKLRDVLMKVDCYKIADGLESAKTATEAMEQ